jgi:dTDP-4-amino-4,6-dideoxygalactose transaminase
VDKDRSGLSRDSFIDAMTKNNIGVGVHYLSIPEHPYYQKTFGWKPEDYPHAMRVGRSTVSIPMSAKLSDRDVGDVIAAIKTIFE